MFLNHKSLSDKLIVLLTIVLFSVFLILDMNPMISIVLIIITLSIFFISMVQRKFIFSPHIGSFHYRIGQFIIFCLLSSTWAYSANLAISKGLTVFEIFICMSILYSHYYDKRNDEVLLKVIAISGTLIAVYCILHYGISTIFNLISTGGHLDGDIANQNSTGMICAFSFIICIFYLFDNKIYSLFLIPLILIVAASTSRKALILLVIGTLSVLVIRAKSKNFIYSMLRIIIIILFTILTLKIVMYLQLFSGVNERMEGLFSFLTGSGKIDNSTILRQMMIKEGLAQFCKTPIFGIGIGNAGMLNIHGFRYLHNNFIELLACGGILGLISYYSIYEYLIINLIKLRKYSNLTTKLIFILIILMLIMDYGAVNYYDKSTYFFFMVFYLHVNYLKREYKKN